jgi:hypothetical protein
MKKNELQKDVFAASDKTIMLRDSVYAVFRTIRDVGCDRSVFPAVDWFEGVAHILDEIGKTLSDVCEFGGLDKEGR